MIELPEQFMVACLAALLEAGDRCAFQGGNPPDPASRYCERAMDLWIAAGNSLVEYRGSVQS